MFASFACSGAEVKHILNANYRGANQDYGTAEPPEDILPQIKQATDWLQTAQISPDDVTAIYISVGGNDVGFADVVEKCFVRINVGGRCNDNPETRANKDKTKDIATKIESLAKEMKSKFTYALIFFSAYPDPLSVSTSDAGDKNKDGICSVDDKASGVRLENDWMWNIYTSDAFFLRDQFLTSLNSAIKSGVTKAGSGVYFVDAHAANGGGNHGFCSSSPNIMFNNEAKPSQGCDENKCGLLGGIYVSKGAWHPNDFGYTNYADAIYGAMKSSGIVQAPTSSIANWQAAPADPRGPWPTAVTSAGKFTMAWADKSNNEDSYEVQYQTGSGKATVATLPSNATSFEFTGAANTVAAYNFAVRACHKHAANGSSTCSNWKSVSVSNAIPTGTPSAATCDNGSGYGMGGTNSCVARFNLPTGMSVSTANFAYVEVRNGANLVGSAIIPVNGGSVSLTYNKERVGTTMNFTTLLWVCSIVDGGKCITGPNGAFTTTVSEPGKGVLGPTIPRSIRPGVQVPPIAGGPPPLALNPLFESGSQCKNGSCMPPGLP